MTERRAPSPSNPKSLLCRLGFHRSMILEADGITPVPQDYRGMRMMVFHELYHDYCTRCGRKKAFNFWIERS